VRDGSDHHNVRVGYESSSARDNSTFTFTCMYGALLLPFTSAGVRRQLWTPHCDPAKPQQHIMIVSGEHHRRLPRSNLWLTSSCEASETGVDSGRIGHPGSAGPKSTHHTRPGCTRDGADG